MSALDTLKDQLDAAWEQIKNSALHSELARQQQAAWDNNEPESRLYLRLDDLHAAIFETAALLADDDIKELTATIANEKDEKMDKNNTDTKLNKYEIGLKDGTTLTAYGTAIGPDTKDQFFCVLGNPVGRTTVAVSEVSYCIETVEED